MIYLDNCATTKMRKEVLNKMYTALAEDFGNPSSLHRLGLKTEKKVEGAREIIGDFLQVEKEEIYFTSGGTESNNLALQSIINGFKRRGKHIITSKIEHPSILNVVKNYEKLGFSVSYLNVDKNGQIKLDEFRKALRQDTILVSIIHVNNEIGTIQDIAAIKRIMKAERSQALLHVDGIQSFGKIDFSLRELEVDSFSFSGHKIYGPKGVGGLYINKNLKLDPITYGGNQEKGLRSGTENVPAIIALGEAVRILKERQKKEAQHVKEIRGYMIEKLKENVKDVRINTPLDEKSSPYVLSLSFINTRGEVLLHYLEDREIYVSTTSACSSKGTEKSHVLQAIGLSDREIEGTIRICFSHETKKEDIDYTVEVLKEIVAEIRQIMGGD